MNIIKKMMIGTLAALTLCLVATPTSSISAATNSQNETTISARAVDNPFTDIKSSDWYYNVVLEAYSKGLMSGTTKGKFSPNDTMSRGMVATVMYRLAGSPNVKYQANFKDVKDGLWYSQAITYCYQNQIISGYKNGNFGPDDAITRQDLAVILYNYASKHGFNMNGRVDLSMYLDSNQVSSYAQTAVSWAVANGIMGDGMRLNPTSEASRAECAKMFLVITKPQVVITPTVNNSVLSISKMKNIINSKNIKEVYFIVNTPAKYTSKHELGNNGDNVLGYVNNDVLYIASKQPKQKVIAPANCYQMFFNCKSLTNINFSSLDTSNVTDMGSMFGSCKSLKSLDLRKFDTSKVTNMSYMFSHCESLTSLNVSNFNTSNVTNMSWMFAYCYELTNLDVSNFDTSNVINTNYMFYFCGGL